MRNQALNFAAIYLWKTSRNPPKPKLKLVKVEPQAMRSIGMREKKNTISCARLLTRRFGLCILRPACVGSFSKRNRGRRPRGSPLRCCVGFSLFKSGQPLFPPHLIETRRIDAWRRTVLKIEEPRAAPRREKGRINNEYRRERQGLR